MTRAQICVTDVLMNISRAITHALQYYSKGDFQVKFIAISDHKNLRRKMMNLVLVLLQVQIFSTFISLN